MSGEEDRAAGLLGIAAKAGRVVSGGTAVEKALRSGEAYLVILSTDASDNTRKKFGDKSAWRQVPLRYFLTKEELGRRLGTGQRSAAAVTDRNLAEAVLRVLDDGKK